MIISTEQIKRRLRQMNITVGDILVDFRAPGHLEVYGRADNHSATVFSTFKTDNLEQLIEDATVHFHASPACEAPVVEYVLEDGRKIPL